MFCSTTQTEKRKSKWNVEMNLNEETFNARFSEMVGSSPESSPECRNFVKITEWGHALQLNRQYTFNSSEPCRLSSFNFEYLTSAQMTQVITDQYDLKKKKTN